MSDRPRHAPATRGTLAAGLRFAVSGFAISALLALISSVLLGRLFGVRIVGEAALVLAPQGVMVFMSTLQEQPVLIRRLATLEPHDPRATGLFAVTFAFSAALTTVMGLIVALGVVLAFNGPLDRPDLIWPALASLAAYVLLWNPLWNLDSVFAAFHDGATLFRVRTHQALVYIAALILTAAISISVWSVVIATAVSYATPLLHRMVRIRRWLVLRGWRHTLPESRAVLPEIISFGLRLSPGSIAAGVSTEAGTWLLGAMAPVQQVGFYNRAFSLTRRLSDVTWRISEMVLPALAQRRDAGDADGEARVWVGALRLAVIGMTFAAGLGAGASAPLMTMFGPGFEDGASTLAILFFIPLTWQIIQMQADLLVAHGHPGVITRMTIPTSLAVVGLEALLIPRFGADGAAAGMLGGTLLRAAIGQVVVRRVCGLHIGALWPWAQRLATLTVGAATTLAGLAVTELLGASVATIIPVLVASAIVGVIVAVVLGAVTRDDLARVRQRVGAVPA